jgi:hypothetical protein
MGVFGQRSAILGNESGQFEVWAYPLKILSDFHLNFVVDGQTQPANTLVRSIVVSPASTTLIYTGDTFTVRETLTVPIAQPVALIQLQIETTEPLDVQAVFHRDFHLEWPAGIGGSDIDWDPKLKAFVLADDQHTFEAVVGSPTAESFQQEYQSNYSSSLDDSFHLGVVEKGTATRTIVIAASAGDRVPAETLYQKSLSDFSSTLDASSRYYADRLSDDVQLSLPDPALQHAYEWAQVSMLQSIVDNPFLGTGLVAGYRTSGDDERPGYAWFFGRDALWSAFALDAEGDFATTRTALEFLTKYQRRDGKIAHEISQTASFVPWFQSLPYAYAAADATPLYLIAANDYVQHSGDVAFAQQHWQNLWKAYQFLVSTDDARGLAQNYKVGTGWVEGGPLFPMRAEFYQSGLGVEATHAFAALARVLHKDELSRRLNREFVHEKTVLNQMFWLPDKQRYAFGLGSTDQKNDASTIMSAVPMWFGLLDPEKADATVTQLAAPDLQTDWGMRILSSKDFRYDPGGYHSGTVWPLFTGWASEAEYTYHRTLAGYLNLETNALLAFGGTPGHVTEVLSGNYYQTLSTGSPAQLWSSAMVVSPLLKGLLGLDADAPAHKLTFAPHVPADWTEFSVGNVKIGEAVIALNYAKTADAIRLDVKHTGSDDCSLKFSPAVSLRATVHGVLLDGHKVPYRLEVNANDQHVSIEVPLKRTQQRLTLYVDDDFGLAEPAALPLLGTAGGGVRVLSQTWTRDHADLRLRIAGITGAEYSFGVWDPGEIASLDGATLDPGSDDRASLRVLMPGVATHKVIAPYVETEVTIHFRDKAGKGARLLR